MQSTSKIIYLKSRNYNYKITSFNLKKSSVQRPAPTSLFGLLMAQGYIPKSYGKTISQYEILRNFTLSDGPNKPRCLLQGKPKVQQKYAHTYVREVDVVQAERLQKLWLDSTHILQSNNCKDMIDRILRMEGVANDQALLSLGEIHKLRCGLRDLTRYYGQKMAA